MALWQTAGVRRPGEKGSLVVVGSGLAGLSCALEAADGGWRVTVVSPGRSGRDGASHRVHLLAPWILLTAPRVKGDSPKQFLSDLSRRAGGLHRPALARVFATSAHQASWEIMSLLELHPLDPEPVVIPGDVHPRGLRCLPRGGESLMSPLVARCRAVGVHFLEGALVTGLRADKDGGIAGVIMTHRWPVGGSRVLDADGVVLACGGVGGAFPLSTVPRWCRGSALALAAAAGALLHYPHLLQPLPVALQPRGYFPTSRVLLHGRIWCGGSPLPSCASLPELIRVMATAGQGAGPFVLQPAVPSDLPEAVRRHADSTRSGRLPLGLAVHHGVGGVAVDTWGRTSVPGLYACGEAAGGVQGARRTMGTGLLEARIFGVRAGRAVVRDAPRLLGRTAMGSVAPEVPAQTEELRILADRELAALAGVLFPEGVHRLHQVLRDWPIATAGGYDDMGAATAAIRRGAVLELLESARRVESLQQGVGDGA